MRPTLSEVGHSHTFQDVIEKGRKARAADKRMLYETKKNKVESERAKATRARLASDIAARNLALESRSNIDADKEKLVNDMEKNLKALLESEFRAEIREKVYKDEKRISAAYEREIQDQTRMQLEKDLEPVIVAELSAEYEKVIKATLKAELKDEVKGELRATLKAEIQEHLRVELESTVRQELRDTYHEQICNELKRELSPSVRAELRNSLGLQHGVLDLDEFANQQPSYPDLSNMQHLGYDCNFQGYGGGSQYDEEEGVDVSNDAPEQSGNSLCNKNAFSDSGLFNSNLPSLIVDAAQSESGLTSTGSSNLKRHIDEDYDGPDNEEHSDVDRPAEKKVKTSSQYDLTVDDGSSVVNKNMGGDFQDEQVHSKGVQYGEKEEDGGLPSLNDNAYSDGKELENNDEQKENGISPIGNGNVSASQGVNVSYGIEELKSDEGKLEGGRYALYGRVNGNDSDHYDDGKVQQNSDQYGEMQYEAFRGGKDPFAEYQDQDVGYNTFKAEEEGDSVANESEEEDEDQEDAEEVTDEDVDEEDTEEEDDNGEEFGNDSLTYGRAQEPYGTDYDSHINGTSRLFSGSMGQTWNGEDDEELRDDPLVSGNAQEIFGNPYCYAKGSEAPRIFSQGMKHSRSEEEEDDVEDGVHGAKRHCAKNSSQNEEESSEVDSMEDEPIDEEYESEGQDAQDDAHALIKETNTQETAFVIDDSDDDSDSQAADEEKTLVGDENSLPPSNKVQYFDESLSVVS